MTKEAAIMWRKITIPRGRWWLLAAVMGVGMAMTVADYRSWRYEETKNYGHGPAVESRPVLALNNLYNNNVIGFRIRYPDGWEEFTLPEYRRTREEGEAVVIRGKQNVVRFWPKNQEFSGRPRVWIEVYETSENLTDLANGVAYSEKQRGERAYVVTDTANITVITAGGEGVIKQLGLTKKGKIFLRIIMEGDEDKWSYYEQTFQMMLKTVVLI